MTSPEKMYEILEDTIKPTNPEPLSAPGSVEYLQSCDELGLYLFLSALGNRAVTEFTPSPTAEQIETYARIGAMTQRGVLETHRFGVTTPTTEDGRPSADYISWLNWWKGFIHGMTDAQWADVQAKVESGANTSDIRPIGDWRTCFLDGAVPGHSVGEALTAEEIKELIALEGEEHKEWQEKFIKLNAARRSEDTIHIFNRDEGLFGYCLVKNRRPFAYIAVGGIDSVEP